MLAPIAWTRRARDAWMGEHGGSVVNVSSIAGLRASPGIGMYGVSKAALIRLTQELAVELGPHIRVNAVAPAVVKTKFATALYEGSEEKVAAAYPMKRLGMPEDIAGAVAFLLLRGRGLDHRPDPGARRRRDSDRHRAVTPPGLDLERLRIYLGSAWPLTATLFAGGRSNLTYAISDGTDRWVLRGHPSGTSCRPRTTWPAARCCPRCSGPGFRCPSRCCCAPIRADETHRSTSGL